MNVFTNYEIEKLTDLQKAFLTLLVEKHTGKRYNNLTNLKKTAIISMVNNSKDILTKKGIQQIKAIFKKLNYENR